MVQILKRNYIVVFSVLLFLGALFVVRQNYDGYEVPVANQDEIKDDVYSIRIPTTFEKIQSVNRKSLARAPKWMSDMNVYKNSYFRYGLPEHAVPQIDLDVGPDFTIPDVITYLLANMKTYSNLNENNGKQGLRYIEIGVSVGKCLYQIQNIFGKSSIVAALEIEKINPAYETTLTNKVIIDTWATPTTKFIRNDGRLSKYTAKDTGAQIWYLETDEFNTDGWDKLKYHMNSFNFIYSDAFHTRDALLYEWNQIKSLNLIDFDSNWVMSWDDLESTDQGSMRGAVRWIMEDCGKITPTNTLIIHVNGWLGHNEYRHIMGIMSNMPIADLLKQLPVSD